MNDFQDPHPVALGLLDLRYDQATGLGWDLIRLGVDGSIKVVNTNQAAAPYFIRPAGGHVGSLNVTTTNNTHGPTIFYMTNGIIDGSGAVTVTDTNAPGSSHQFSSPRRKQEYSGVILRKLPRGQNAGMV